MSGKEDKSPQAHPAAGQVHPPDGPPSGRKVLIIGLDGATWDVLKPVMDEGHMPHLKRVVDSGVSGVLHSTIPPITPAAWTTFLTGKDPGKHGIVDFESYDPRTNKLEFNSTLRLRNVRNIWQILSDKGLKVGSINIPMTYPPIPVHGFMISGFETPGPAADFAYPPELKPEILKRWPDPTLRAKWQRTTFGGDRLFAENLDYIARSFRQGAEMTRFCGERFGWDALMVVLKLTDNLQHKTWKYIDERWRDRDLKRRDMVRACWIEADNAVGELMDYAEANEARVLIVSDHGHGSLEGKVQPNLLLKRWGYLVLQGGTAQGTTRTKYIFDRVLGRTRKFAREGDILHDLAIDFTQTRACVMHAGMAGFLYINLEGRQPCGIVPQSDYENLRNELKQRFLGSECRVRDPEGRWIQLFRDVHKPEELYDCSRKDQPWLPDLMLIPHHPLAVIRKIRGNKPVRWLSRRRIEGTHRPEGIVAAWGPGIRRGATTEMNIADCAPTILAMLGVAIPNDMDGKTAINIFEETPKTAYEPAQAVADSAPPEEAAFTQEELARVSDRLSDLGYLE